MKKSSSVHFIFLMKNFLVPASFAAFALLAACGGGIEKIYPSYEVDVATLHSAPTSLLSADAGPLQLSATGQELNFAIDIMKTRIDPVSGQVYVSSLPLADKQRTIFLGFALIKAKFAGGFELAATGWTARTAWILQGDKYVSTKDIESKDGAFFLTLDDPPLNRNQPASIVVEFNTANETTLLQGAIQWR
ncbi:hypothetical protein [Janthinobacterium lividum]|nr:hypothetical protein [Janthinobacterium lividum]